jgi:hypothetical protein
MISSGRDGNHGVQASWHTRLPTTVHTPDNHRAIILQRHAEMIARINLDHTAEPCRHVSFPIGTHTPSDNSAIALQCKAMTVAGSETDNIA